MNYESFLQQKQRIRRRRNVSSLALAGSVLVIILITLYPFRFEHFERVWEPHHYFSGFDFGGYSRCCTYLGFVEPMANVLLFIPFGAATAEWMRRYGQTPIVAFAAVVLLSFGLTFSVEFLQIFIPRRSPSVTDLVMNTIGGALGYAGYALGRRVVHRIRWARRPSA